MALLAVNAGLGDPGRLSFPTAAVFAGLWTLPGLVIPLRTASRYGVLGALALPLCLATGVSALAFRIQRAGLMPSRSKSRPRVGSGVGDLSLCGMVGRVDLLFGRTGRPDSRVR